MHYINCTHGNGVFLADNYAGYDFLNETMKDDIKKIDDNYTFFNFVTAHNGGYFDRPELLNWFHSTWRLIPKNYLYETYKEILIEVNYHLRDHWFYNNFFLPDLVNEIITMNHHDTVENPVLTSLLDENGYLTVYHGHCKKTLHGSNSWMLSKEGALYAGQLYAWCSSSPDYYCVTGKVKLTDLIAYIPDSYGRGDHGHEIVVLQKFVQHKSKEVFKSKETTVESEQKPSNEDVFTEKLSILIGLLLREAHISNRAVQKLLGVGYHSANEYLDRLVAYGLIPPADNNRKPRRLIPRCLNDIFVLLDKHDFAETIECPFQLEKYSLEIMQRPLY